MDKKYTDIMNFIVISIGILLVASFILFIISITTY